jgi:hypothetical protein
MNEQTERYDGSAYSESRFGHRTNCYSGNLKTRLSFTARGKLESKYEHLNDTSKNQSGLGGQRPG